MNPGRIVFDNVSKRFHRGPAFDSLRDLIPAILGKNTRGTELGTDDFWAVKDVSFDVKPGDSLGIIGGNGAGKSTTLKLLTRILQPTRGHAEITGRVGSLIEVSAGFHPDLTGRENVFLQGAIMGMPQALIRKRFDDIVDFAGVGPFIDTPVKRYSSGMNARLGFSIAVHLEPDVLIVDEVLSVGDATFQAQAFARIKSVVKSDIPVVIVSHQLDRIVELCTECILLSKGSVAARGNPAEVVHRYLSGDTDETLQATGRVEGFSLKEIVRENREQISSGELMQFTLRGSAEAKVPDYVRLMMIVSGLASSQELFHTAVPFDRSSVGEFELPLQIRANLPTGQYRLTTLIWNERSQLSTHGPAAFFDVIDETAFAGTVQLSLEPQRR